MNYIVFKKLGRKSLKTISLFINTQHNILRNKKILGKITNLSGVVIRWANAIPLPISKYSIIYNFARSIEIASNKMLCRDILERNNIPTPTHGIKQFPCIGRPSHHMAGKKLFICNNENDVVYAIRNGATYFSSFYPKQNEYRVHVAHGKVLICSEKCGGDKDTIIWNHDIGGFKFIPVPWEKCPIDVLKQALRAIESVGLDFGAVDILANPTDNTLPPSVVCEINTGPNVEGYTAQRYAEYFQWLFVKSSELKHRIEHFNVLDKKKSKSCILKHSDLDIETPEMEIPNNE